MHHEANTLTSATSPTRFSLERPSVRPWTGGNAMSVLMFMVLFPAFTVGAASGQFNRDAYALYGEIAGALIFASILISAAGTHSRIPHLKAPPPKRRLTLFTIFKEIFESLWDRSFAALFVATIFGSIAAGMAAALAFYIASYFWGFSTLQIGLQTIAVFVSAVIGALLAPIVTRKMGKKRGAMIIGLIAFIGAPLPIVLRLFDLIPDGSNPAVFWFVLITGMIDVGLIICFQILASAMMADLVEASELKTGRRAEGIFVAAILFVRKMVTGLGVMAAPVLWLLATWIANGVLFTLANRWDVDGRLFLSAAYYRSLVVAYAPWLVAGLSVLGLSRHVD